MKLRVDTSKMNIGTIVVLHVPLSDSIANIPEFHDCQRFIVKEQGKLVYDSLFAIFASFRLDRLAADLDTSNDTTTIAGVHMRTIPVATVFSDHEYYPALGIEAGFNCLLLLSGSVSGQPVWNAKMIPLTRPDSNCFGAKQGMRGKDLQVHAGSIPGLSDSDYPAAARWDWSPRDTEQYIGIKCGAAWCQIGRSGFDTSARYAGPPLPFKSIPSRALTSTLVNRVTGVRGWYDDQWLDKGSAGHHQVTAVWGTLVPNPLIHGLDSVPDQYAGKWIQVGFAVVSANYPKWNIRYGVNEVMLCHGSAETCRVGPSVLTQPAQPPSKIQPGNCPNGWLASVGRVSSGLFPDQDSKFFCLKETNHSAQLHDLNMRFGNIISSIPGTARWRWLLSDAGGWWGCETGSCCTPR